MLSIEYIHKRVKLFRIELGPIVLMVLFLVLLAYEVLRWIKFLK